ncbi:glycosyltransferase family 4 protein [Asticcacaulis sp. BYS171W]|uniref:Glycosyltransferase family 4 protein n=1 Tax=Asticcacaulis aquaticus TaxID=2984212 RepID=A0ABT5HV89_9CAUL|nr:glycosyltransferase family 4 protein [Asticcacaulis aquaticus]MDC7683996.1 glycosyltransferase family 4 protein [Asticcacaulis aquaticus]
MPNAFPYTVLQVVPELDTGGVEQTVVDIARAVIEAGGRAVVVSKGGRLEGYLKSIGAVVHRLPVHSKNPYVQWKNYFALKALIKQEKADIVHVRSRAPALSALPAAKALGVKTVTTYHGIYNAGSAAKRWYNGRMTTADITIANSNYTRDHILKTYDVDPTKVIAIPRGVDLSKFDPAAVDEARLDKLAKAWGIDRTDGRTRFLLAGRLTRWKGQALVIEALAQLADNRVQLILAGDDQGRAEYTTELKARILTHWLGDQVALAGHCSDMPAAYALCDFALAPSLEPEAFGRTAVEPQAMGKPVLAAKHGATVETVEDGVSGWLIAPGDKLAWADAMKAATLTTPDVRAEMGAAGQVRVREHFSLEAMCEATLAVYRSLLI